jgi:hypothetical protein
MMVLSFFLVVCVLMGAAVLLWDRAHLGSPASLDQYEWFLDRSSRFAHLRRITASDDFDFLRALPNAGHLLTRMQKERRLILRLVLKDLRQEFRALLAVGVMLSALPTARESSFGVKLMMRMVEFNLRYYWMYSRTLVPVQVAGGHIEWLADRLADTRGITRDLLASLNPRDMDLLRDRLLEP